MPMMKLGTDMVIWVSTVTARSTIPPGRRAARRPRGREMAKIRAKDTAASISVTWARVSTSFATGESN